MIEYYTAKQKKLQLHISTPVDLIEILSAEIKQAKNSLKLYGILFVHVNTQAQKRILCGRVILGNVKRERPPGYWK